MVRAASAGLLFKVKFAAYKRLHAVLTGLDTVRVWEAVVRDARRQWLRRGKVEEEEEEEADDGVEALCAVVPDECVPWVRETVAGLKVRADGLMERARAVLREAEEELKGVVEGPAQRARLGAFLQRTADKQVAHRVFLLRDGQADRVWYLCLTAVKPASRETPEFIQRKLASGDT